jgi:dolichyl-phosphate beta-glucosyltransferase
LPDSSQLFISIVIPAFNEAGRIQSAIYDIWNYMSTQGSRFEIIVVDNSSTDGTDAVVSSIADKLENVRLIRTSRSNRGKGYAVKKGIFASQGNLLLYCDADMSAPIKEIEKLITWIGHGFDISIGSRAMKESHITVKQPWYRGIMGRIFNCAVKVIVLRGIRDTQCGFKLFRGDIAKKIFNKVRIEGFGFDVEVLFIAGKLGYSIKEVPIEWSDAEHSKVKIVKDSLYMLMGLFLIRYNWFAGSYK